MKCPIDKTEMEKGFSTGMYWRKGQIWNKSIGKMINGGNYVIAWKCPKCGKIELKLEEV